MKCGFFLMTQKGFDVVSSLVLNKQITFVDFVCIGRDTNLENDFSDEIENLCQDHDITFFYRESLQDQLKKSDYYIAISWRWLIDLPNLIIIHDSILPMYRGFAPLVNMLINGEKEIGATALLASSEYDRGAIVAQKKIAIQYPILINEAINQIGKLYIKLVSEIISLAISKSFKPIPQNEENATYCVWLDNEDYFINWSWTADKIKRKIDACGYPYQGAKSILDGEIVIIESAEVEKDITIENRIVGKVIFIRNNYPIIICGEGLLKLTKATKANNKENILPLNKFRSKFK